MGYIVPVGGMPELNFENALRNSGIDIKSVDMPILYELVSEYYDPEFSKEAYGDIKKSINRTREVIEKWK